MHGRVSNYQYVHDIHSGACVYRKSRLETKVDTMPPPPLHILLSLKQMISVIKRKSSPLISAVIVVFPLADPKPFLLRLSRDWEVLACNLEAAEEDRKEHGTKALNNKLMSGRAERQ